MLAEGGVGQPLPGQIMAKRITGFRAMVRREDGGKEAWGVTELLG